MGCAGDVLAIQLFAIFALFDSVTPLGCYKCISLEASSSTSWLNSLITGKSDPNCYPLNQVATSVTTCPSGSYKCGLIKGEVSFSVPIVGNFKINTHIRDCMPVIPGTSDGCKKNEDVSSILNSALSFVSGALNLQLDGDVCYCSTSYCDADSCSDSFSFMIAGVCISWWYVIGGGGGLLFLILCCVCCCFCCASSGSRGRVVSVQPQPQPTVMVVGMPGSQPAYGPGQPAQPAYGYAAGSMQQAQPYTQPGMAVVNPSYEMQNK